MASSTSKILINAPAQRVWDAVTKPELVKQWQYGSDLITDWSIGGRIVFRSEWEGGVFEQWGTVLEFDPCRTLRYSLFAPRPELEDKPENYFIMSYTLHEEGDGTLLTIKQDDARPGADDIQESDGAGQSVLEALKQLAESPDR
ncbi:MAG: SRPBCC domain-containing protein [Eggerthellaceae bacterium]|nr:SRPBCC domain-containing protein [Eggerthellaceae bacterium]